MEAGRSVGLRLKQGFFSLGKLLSLAGFSSALCIQTAFSMDSLDDQTLGGVTGEGVAIVLEDWRFAMRPTSYMEQIGTNLPNPRPSGMTFRRGDLRWYGLTMSAIGSANSSTWLEGACSGQGYNGLGCPRGGDVPLFAAHDNPYIIRAFNYTGWDTTNSSVERTVFDILAPTSQDYYRFAFWGEIIGDKTNQFPGDPGGACPAGGCRLKAQTIIQGNAANSKLKLLRVTDPNNASQQTLGLIYDSWLRGDFRFSVAQLVGNDTEGQAVNFDPNEGLHFRNVVAHLPLGQMFYQAMTLDATSSLDGNFTLELGRVPNQSNVIADFYSANAGDTVGYTTAYNGVTKTGTQPSARYYETHGYVTWGDWYPGKATGTRNGANDSNDGIFFVSKSAYSAVRYRWTNLDVADFRSNTSFSGNTLGMTYGAEGITQNTTNIAAGGVANLGDSRIDGLLMNHLKLTSLGANQ